MIDPMMDEIARAEANHHGDCFCSHLSLHERERIWNVIYTIVLSALQTFDELCDKGRDTRSFPPMFSLN